MIDKAKTIESLLDALESINRGEAKERIFVLVLSSGERIKQPLKIDKNDKRVCLRLVRSDGKRDPD